MEGGSIEAPVMDLPSTEAPAMACAAEVGMENDDHKALQTGDSIADLVQQERAEGDSCIDRPKNVEVTVFSSAPRTVDVPGILLRTSHASEVSSDTEWPATCVKAEMPTEDFSVTENILEQPTSLSKAIDEDAHIEADEISELGKQLCTQCKINLEEKKSDESEAIHQDNDSGSYEERSITSPDDRNLGSSSSENKRYDNNVVETVALSLEIVDEALRPRSPEAENLGKNLEFLVRVDNPGGENQEDQSKVVHDGVKEVQNDTLQVSQGSSNVLESKRADSPEKREIFAILERAVSPQVLGPVTDDESRCSKGDECEAGKNDRTPEVSVQVDKEGRSLLPSQSTYSTNASYASSGEKSESEIENKTFEAAGGNPVQVTKGAKTIESVCKQDLIVAKTSGEEIHESPAKQICATSETEVDVQKGGSCIVIEPLNKPLNRPVGVDFTSKDFEIPIVGLHDDELLEFQHRGMDFSHGTVNDSDDACSLKEFQKSKGSKVVGESPILTAKQGTIVGQEDNPVVEHCKAGNGAASSEEQSQQGCSHDKDGGSSMDSTAGSGWKLCGMEGQVALEEGDNSGSEDSASSPAGIQPQQRKKRIDLQHQFVREIVRIQHDREQFDRDLFERQIQPQRTVSSAQQGAKSMEIQTFDSKANVPYDSMASIPYDSKKSSLVGKRQLRNDLGKNFMNRRLSDRGGSDRHVKDSQPTPYMYSKNVAPVHAKGVTTQLKENMHEGNGAAYSLEGSQQGKLGQNKYNRFMPIYRPPNVRDSFASGSDEQTNAVQSDFSNLQSASFFVSSSPESSTNSVPESCIPHKGSAKREKDKGTLTVVKSSSGERYVHYAGSQVENVKGMGIKVTFDTENHQRHIEFSGVDPPRQRKLVERGTPSSLDHCDGFVSHLGLSLGESADNTAFTHSSQASFNAWFGSSPPVGHGNGTSSEMLSSGKGKHSQRTKRGLLARTTIPMKLDAVSPPIVHAKMDPTSQSNQFQPSLDKGLYGSFEGKHRFSNQADIPVTMQKPSSWFQDAPLIPVPFSSNPGASIHDAYSGKSRHVEERSGGGVNSYSQNPAPANLSKDGTLEGFWSNSNWGEFSTDGQVGKPLSMNNIQIPQVTVSSAERTHTGVNGKLNINSADRGKEKRDLKTRNRTKDYKSCRSTVIEDFNPSQSMSSSHSHQQSDILQSGLDSKGSKQNKIQMCEDNGGNLQESLVSENCSGAENSEKGSTVIPQAHLSPLSLEDSTLRSTCFLGKWGDIVDDSPDSYDYLQMRAEYGMEGAAEGSQSGTYAYEYNIPRNSDSTDAAISSNEKPMLRDFSKDQGSKKNGLNEYDRQKNKARDEMAQNIVHSANETPARKSVFQRLGPQNVFGGSILGRPPQVIDEKDVIKAVPNVFPNRTFDFNTRRNFEAGFHGSAQALHGARLSTVLHDSPYDAEFCANIYDECTEVVVQAYKDAKQRRSKRELYVPRRGL